MNDLVHTYLREIARVPLLTQEQEILYGKQVQQMMSLLKAKKTMTKKLNREPTMPEWVSHFHLYESEINEILRRGQQAKQKMVEANLRLVVTIAKKYQKLNVELLDLIQEGAIGLTQGVDKFDPTRGYKLSTYVFEFIRQAIVRAIAANQRTIRLPLYIIVRLNKIKRAQHHLSQQLGRAPTTSELAAAVHLTPKQVSWCLEQVRLPLSLDMLVGDNQHSELGELLSDTGATPEEYVEQLAFYKDLVQMMASLTPQQREVLSLRFGLMDGQVLNRTQIGVRLSLSSYRVGWIERKTLHQLRRRYEAMSSLTEGQEF